MHEGLEDALVEQELNQKSKPPNAIIIPIFI
jgi:hypothetical protein